MRPIEFTWGGYAIASGNSIATSQTATGAVDLTLNGALSASKFVYVAQIPPNVTTRIATLTVSGLVTITSAGDDSGITFTIYGTNNSGADIQETVTGADTDVATSTLSFKTVTRIATSGATADAVTVGTAQAGQTDWIPLDIYTPNQVTNISVTVSGTINYTVQYTNEDPFNLGITQQTVSHPVAGLVGATTSQTAGATTTLMRAVRFKVNSGSGTGRVTIVQQSTI
jgi:hypothetical protein